MKFWFNHTKEEIESIRWMSFEDFFSFFKEDEIGHGLLYLKENLEILKKENLIL